MKRNYSVAEIEVARSVFSALISIPKGNAPADAFIDEAWASALRIIRGGLAEIEAEHAKGNER